MQDNDSQRLPTDDSSPEACFPRRLRERREALGWSQVTLAENLRHVGLKLDPTAITRIEKGTRKVGLNEATGLALILGVDLDWLTTLNPGELFEQVSRAHDHHQNALWALDYWEKEAERRRLRADELRAQLREQEAYVAERRQMFLRDVRKHAEAHDVIPEDAPAWWSWRIVLDVERLQQLPKDQAGPLARYVAMVQSERGDYDNKAVALGRADLRALAVLYERSVPELAEELISWGVLDPESPGLV